MTPFRVFQLSVAALIVVAHVWIIQALDAASGTSPDGASGANVALAQGPAPTATATPAPVVTVVVVVTVVPSGDNADNDDGDNDGDGDNGEGGNGNGNGNGNDNEDDLGGTASFDLPPRPTPTQVAAPVCSTPGQETLFQSANQRVTVRVFPSMEPSVLVEIRPVLDLLSIPAPPGQLVGLLIHDVVAGICADGGARLTPIRVFPAEVNLQFDYTDIEVLGLDESRLEVAHLDFQTVQWTRVEKQELNVARNAIGATITQTGFYAVYQRP